MTQEVRCLWLAALLTLAEMDCRVESGPDQRVLAEHVRGYFIYFTLT